MMRLSSNPNLPLWLLTMSLVIGLTAPILIQAGMFQDGILYSCVSHNLAIGHGTFWFPQYSTLNIEGIPSFHEQPPLVFGIQSLFFKVLGDSMYVERFYTFLMLMIHVVLIHIFWKMVFRENTLYASLSWLPVLFWIGVPVCFWSFRHNMIENTMSVFTLSAVILGYKAIQSLQPRIGLWILSGFFIFLATFSKGIPGFFPITFPFIYWLFTRKISFASCCLYTAILIGVPVILYSTLLFFPDSRKSLSIYFFDRLLMRVNARPTADYRLQIVWRLLNELIPILVATAILVTLKWKSFKSGFSSHQSLFWVFFVVAMAGTLPLTLTMVQNGWYMVPAFPFIAMSFAILIMPVIADWISRIRIENRGYKFSLFISAFLLGGVLVFTSMQKGKISRHADIIHDVKIIGSVVPRWSTLTIPYEMYDQYYFVLQGLLVRDYNISISPYQQYDFYLKEKRFTSKPPSNYVPVDIGLIKYDFFRNQYVE